MEEGWLCRTQSTCRCWLHARPLNCWICRPTQYEKWSSEKNCWLTKSADAGVSLSPKLLGWNHALNELGSVASFLNFSPIDIAFCFEGIVHLRRTRTAYPTGTPVPERNPEPRRGSCPDRIQHGTLAKLPSVALALACLRNTAGVNTKRSVELIDHNKADRP